VDQTERSTTLIMFYARIWTRNYSTMADISSSFSCKIEKTLRFAQNVCHKMEHECEFCLN